MPSLRLHRLLIAASVLVPAGLFAVAALHSRSGVLREGRDAVTRSAAVMHEHARKVFETGELALGRVDDHVRGLPRDEIAAPGTSAFLARLKAPLEQAVSIWVTDAQGVVLAGSQPWNPAVTVAERGFFQAQRERDAGTYVSAAFQGKATGTASFAVSRRRSAPDGRFDGTVHISLSPGYFARFYADAAPELPHFAALVRADGEVLAREPHREAVRRLGPDSPLVRQIAAQPEGGFSVGTSDVDGRERMYAYRKVAGYPLYVVFGVETAVLMGQWHADLAAFAAAAGAASLMLLLVSWLVLRGVKAERAAAARLRSALGELTRETARRQAAEHRVLQAQRMEAVGQLTAGIAHDFNNLLTAVLGSLQLLRKRLPPGDERAGRLLDTAEQGARRGASLVQRLLAFGRGQALKPEAVDVPGLVRGMSDLLRSSLGAGVRVETRFPADLAPARVDANQLEMALLNLAVNARDAMPGGGRLLVSAREERAGAVSGGPPGSTQGGELPPGDYVVLGVADTGTGMDEATLARAAEPFFTTKGVGRGTGLGLSMVHGLTAQSGGRLVLASREGEGTVAELWLPRADEQPGPPVVVPGGAPVVVPGGAPVVVPGGTPGEAGSEPSVPAAGAVEARPEPLRRRTVLAVDDDPLVLASAAFMLEDLGHAVVEAASGHQALEILRAGAQLDVVIADQSMPGMTGTQLAAELRRLRPGLPVLIATGYAERSELAAAGLPLLAKPFGQAALAEAVGGCPSTRAVQGGQVVPFRAR